MPLCSVCQAALLESTVTLHIWLLPQLAYLSMLFIFELVFTVQISTTMNSMPKQNNFIESDAGNVKLDFMQYRLVYWIQTYHGCSNISNIDWMWRIFCKSQLSAQWHVDAHCHNLQCHCYALQCHLRPIGHFIFITESVNLAWGGFFGQTNEWDTAFHTTATASWFYT